MHLYTQSMVSTLNELLLTVNSYPLVIVTLSKTWLRDQPQLLDCFYHWLCCGIPEEGRYKGRWRRCLY